MKNIICIVSLVLLFSCNKKEINLSNLDGYWEITKAENNKGKSKEFPYNQTVDYFVLKDSTGFRKKLKPLYNGKYKGSKDIENFMVITKDDASITLKYSTNYDSWEEEILSLTSEELVLQNKNGIIYTYAPYTGFKKIEDEE